jgi:hypothetical protein
MPVIATRLPARPDSGIIAGVFRARNPRDMARDVAGGIGTTATLDAEDFVRGTLEKRGDHDWYRIELDPGHYVLRLGGAGDDPVGDPLLVLRNQKGDALRRNDDADLAESRIEFEVTGAPKTYFLDVSGKGPYTVPRDGDGVAGRKVGHATGDFTLSVNRLDGSPLDAVAGAQWLEERVIDVYFAPEGTRGEVFDGGRTIASAGWAPWQIRKAMAALDALSEVCDIDFRQTRQPSNADFKLLTYDKPSDYAGLFQAPGTIGEGTGVFDYWEIRPKQALGRGAFGWELMLHEFGHGLGLAHPHDEGFGSTVMRGVGSDLDRGAFRLNTTHSTVMSYRFGDESPWLDAGYVAGPMAFDIAALQAMYGAVRSHHGDDSYRLPTRDAPGTGYLCLWDTGGEDTIHAGRTERNVTIDLGDATLEYGPGGGGFVSRARGVHGGLTIANGVEIENAAGGDGDDRLSGNGLANRLSGDAGADRLLGRAGADRLGAGDDDDRDVLVYRSARDSGPSMAEADRIAGFDHRNGRREGTWDRIDLSALDGNPDAPGNQKLDLVRSFAAPGSGEVRTDRQGGDVHVLIDLDGDRAADMRLIVLDAPRLGEDDFLL